MLFGGLCILTLPRIHEYAKKVFNRPDYLRGSSPVFLFEHSQPQQPRKRICSHTFTFEVSSSKHQQFMWQWTQITNNHGINTVSADMNILHSRGIKTVACSTLCVVLLSFSATLQQGFSIFMSHYSSFRFQNCHDLWSQLISDSLGLYLRNKLKVDKMGILFFLKSPSKHWLNTKKHIKKFSPWRKTLMP